MQQEDRLLELLEDQQKLEMNLLKDEIKALLKSAKKGNRSQIEAQVLTDTFEKGRNDE
jgi:alpha-galactosidase